MPAVGFLRWTSDQPSGGNRYDDEIVAGVAALGVELREYPVTGTWPLPTEADVATLAEQLRHEDEWLVGNIVASAVPELIADAVAAGRRITVLMHYFPADGPDLAPADRERLAESEQATVTAATTVVTTSRWAADELAARYARRDAHVAVPGTDPAEPARGSIAKGRPPMLLWLGRLTRTKDPVTLVDALATLRDLDWTARLVGPTTVDEQLTDRVQDRITTLGLTDRIIVPGAQHGGELAATWDDTDLLVHTSRAETYGMVVAEALARGVPSIIATGTGAVEAQQVGAAFPPGDADALADHLRTWLTDPELRGAWRAAAERRRAELATWQDTARAVATALGH